MSDWWLANGTIDSANVLEHVENPGIGQAYAGGDPGSAWSIAFRSNLTYVPSQNFIFDAYVLIGVHPAFNGFYTGANYVDIGLFKEGDHFYCLTYNGSSYQAYIDTVAVGDPYVDSGTIHIPAYWRARNPYAWPFELVYAFVGNTSLTETQRTNLMLAMGIGIAVTAAETISVIDSAPTIDLSTITAAETISVTDLPTAIVSSPTINTSESVYVFDSADLTSFMLVTADTFAVSDALLMSGPGPDLFIGAADGLTVTESGTAQLLAFSCAETIYLSEEVTIWRGFHREYEDLQAPAYEIRTFTPAGVATHRISDMLAFSYIKEVNAPGLATFDLTANHAAIADFALDAQIEIWRKGHGIDWYCDWYGFWRGEKRSQDSSGRSVYQALCIGQMTLIDRPVINYNAAVTDRTTFTGKPAETIAKSLVTYNATSSGTTGDGRKRTVTVVGVSVQADAAKGNVFDFACAWQKLLQTLQSLAKVGAGDFDLVKTGARTWEFRWYDGQLGADKSASVTFATGYGNMANPTLTVDHLSERTVAIVGGQGEETARSVAVVNAQPFAVGTNDGEMFVDARQYTTVDGLEARGDAALIEAYKGAELTFDVLQAPSTLYGPSPGHYVLGDLVSAVYQSVSAVKQVNRVTVSMGGDKVERIAVETRDTLAATLSIPRVRASETVFVADAVAEMRTFSLNMSELIGLVLVATVNVIPVPPFSFSVEETVNVSSS
jgi:hypothetical protein